MFDSVTIQVVADGNTAPVASASYVDQSEVGLFLPVTVQLTNSSYDLDDDVLKYRWVQIAGPFVHINSTTAAPTFIPQAPGIYVFSGSLTE